ncbi:hypothetical protein FQB35_13805 [Crassaminicella thermophila]|uniref:Uncharacterized protein n=1 Tax=Crassaminicella thermophila TaxID=2599308 RepID=A0A5C0SJZ1_CRATE|nr:hypothetical protein [Crassaminicella thermophila]QEK13259.1 hypothetical protein FQB35_13805 [Crassaminicella thermophila]
MKKIWILLFICVLLASTVSYGDINGPYREGFIEGYVKNRLENQIMIEEYDGTVHLLDLDRKVSFQIDGIPAALEDFRVGMEVYGELRGRRLTYLESYSTQNLGYIPPGGKVRSGIVKKIDRDQISIITLTGKEETYFTSPATIVLKKGVTSPLSTLYEGDHVRLYFDEIDTEYISRMNIEGDSILVKDLYRGKLAVADEVEDVIILEDVEVFRNGNWTKVIETMRIPYNKDVPLYIGARKIAYRNLKYYKGKTVYMAIKDFFGSEKVARMVIRNKYETIYADKIENINRYSNMFELSNHKNIDMHDGTIVIKNGRLVDKSCINQNSDAFVVADGRGDNIVADVVKITSEDLNNSNIGQNYIYAGRLSRIFKDKVYLKDFYILNKHDWESFRTKRERDEKELFYDNDTVIFDLENKKYISPKEFFSGNYAVDEESDYVRDHNLEDWYGYIYTDGDRIMSIMVQENLDSLRKQRITNGIIEKATDDELVGWTIYLRDANDWSHRHEEWMAKNTTVRVNLEKAMIIKNGKIINPYELQPGNRLYMVRDDFTGKVVIVK